MKFEVSDKIRIKFLVFIFMLAYNNFLHNSLTFGNFIRLFFIKL